MKDTYKFEPLDLLELSGAIGTAPMSVGQFVARQLQKMELSARQAATAMGYSNSTVSRLIAGGELSIDMAVSLHRAFQFPIDGLFQLEANHKTFLANESLKKKKGKGAADA